MSNPINIQEYITTPISVVLYSIYTKEYINTNSVNTYKAQDYNKKAFVAKQLDYNKLTDYNTFLINYSRI